MAVSKLKPDSINERLDGREFKPGELVKARNKYMWVYEDNRKCSYKTYTYTLLPVIPEPGDIIEFGTTSYTVYCEYPKDIEPCNEAEYILYDNYVKYIEISDFFKI